MIIRPQFDRARFQSFWVGGLECSSHRLGSGKRLDMLNSTQHDRFVAQDYRHLKEHGFATIRSGIRWHLIEKSPHQYDFSTVLPMIRAAREEGVQIIWDLCHYGWPDDLDIFSNTFIKRYAKLAGAFARLLDSEGESNSFISPINEISFFAWGGGDAGYLNPFQRGRGFELKVHLVTTAIAGIDAIREVLPDARIVHVDPVIQVTSDPWRPHDHHSAEGHRVAQYQAWDMLTGRAWPQLGGDPSYMDVIGVNYYSNNQWIHGGHTLHYRDPLYRPFRWILQEVYERYRCPLFIGETGAEDDFRPEWLRYVATEVAGAIANGVPVQGITLYPVINHPGWDNDRHCHNGLFDYADANGDRPVFQPLADEVQLQDQAIRLVQDSIYNMQTAQIRHLADTLDGAARLKVCLFTDSLESSGMGEHMLLLAQALAPTHDVIFVMPPSESNQSIISRAMQLTEHFPVRVELLEVRGGPHGRAAWEMLRDLVRDEKVDIFHGHAGIQWEGHDGFYAAWFANTPIVLRTEHLPYKITDFHEKTLYRHLVGEIDHLIVVSEESHTSYLNAGVPEDKVSVVRNGVQEHTATQSREQIRASLGLKPGELAILTAGRMTEQKGYHHLLNAIPTILGAHPEARFIWAGDGPLAGTLDIQIAASGLSDHILRLGWRSDVRDLIAAVDLYVLPSEFEGLPLVLLESMAAGTPVIATCVGGVNDVITDRVHGGLVEPRDPAALAEAVIDALDHPMLRATWSAQGKMRFAQGFSVDHMTRETVAVYRRLVAAQLEAVTHQVVTPVR